MTFTIEIELVNGETFRSVGNRHEDAYQAATGIVRQETDGLTFVADATLDAYFWPWTQIRSIRITPEPVTATGRTTAA